MLSGRTIRRWLIGTRSQPRGVTVDAKNKNLIVSDKYLNGVATYHFPELFEPDTRQTARAALT